MSQYFFSRRAFHKKKFTHNLGSVTRYCRFTTSPKKIGVYPDEAHWAKDILQDAAGGDIVCFVHGYNTSNTEMLERAAKIEAGLKKTGKFTGIVIGYDWPSDGKTVIAKNSPKSKKTLAYNSDREDAKRSAAFFVPEGLDFLRRQLKGGQKLHVLAHSMGARVVTRSFERSSDKFGKKWKIGELVFAAADIDSEEMEDGNSYAMTVERRSKRLTNYHSALDDTLNISKNFVNGGRERLGNVGLPALRTKHMNDVDCGNFYENNFGTLGDIKRSHTWYFDEDAFFKDLASVLKGNGSASERTLK